MIMIKICENCRGDFATNHPNHKYCSKECSRESILKPHPARPCAWCAEEFVPLGSNNKYCDHACYTEATAYKKNRFTKWLQIFASAQPLEPSGRVLHYASMRRPLLQQASDGSYILTPAAIELLENRWQDK